jgi:hypothetical protein
MTTKTEETVGLSLFAVFVLGFLIGPPTLMWYKAGIQQRVYQRQNIEITQWEVFMGADPAEKVMQIKNEQ